MNHKKHNHVSSFFLSVLRILLFATEGEGIWRTWKSVWYKTHKVRYVNLRRVRVTIIAVKEN